MPRKKQTKTRTVRSMRRLSRKRQMVIEHLRRRGVMLKDDAPDMAVLTLGYKAGGRTLRKMPESVASLHAHYGNVMQDLDIHKDWKKENREIWDANQLAKAAPKDNLKDFYKTYEWRKLRYQILKRDGGKCQLCGATAVNGAVLNVDHIRPLRKHWDLRLDPKNLQTLCGACNHGKGNWDETDWRPKDMNATTRQEDAA